MAAVSEEAKARKRAAGRAYMAARRAADPEAARQKYRDAYARDPEKYKAKVRAYRASLTPEEARARNLRFKLRRAYGLEVKELDALRAAQDYRCAICGRHEDDLPKVRPSDHFTLFVDHCHDTDKVRGLLCQSCNLLVGHGREDEAILRRAIDYLAAHRKA